MTDAQMIRKEHSTKDDRLYMAFELSNSKWKILFSNGVKRRQKTIAARQLDELQQEISRSKSRFALAEDVAIYSCYEAGRDGFWLHRYLEASGINNFVVDSSSIEVNRRHRRAKTDRIDVIKLMSMLLRYLGGECRLWSVLHVPSVAQEDARRIHREIERLKKEKTAHSNRIKSLLILHGVSMSVGQNFLAHLEQAVQWDGRKLPVRITNEIVREYRRYELIKEQLKHMEAEQQEILQSGSGQANKVIALRRLKGIGPVGSWKLGFEYFGWRVFKNVKQVGAAAGLAPTPYASGQLQREQGISKAGNRRVRSLMIELSWYWLRYQPQSHLSRWYMQRFGGGGSRMRRVGIVALARKLLIALWKYLEQGIVPEGAVLKPLV
jgi:transposase